MGSIASSVTESNPITMLVHVLSLVYTTKDKTLNKHELTNYIGCNAASNVAVHSLISFH